MRTKSVITNMTLTAMFTAVIIVAGMFNIPTGFHSPINLVDMFVILAGFLLGPKYGLLAIVTYILLGFVGVPVFSNFSAGWGVLASPRGGFIFSFIPAVLFVGSMSKRCRGSLVMTIFTALFAYIIIFAVGSAYAIYLATPSVPSWTAAWSVMILPFMPGTAVKTVLVVTLQRNLHSALSV